MNEKNPCFDCDLCCKHIALEIDAPEDNEDYDQIRWYLVHENVSVFIDHDNSWNLQFNTPCEKLDNKTCSIYKKRPSICRGYKTDSCEKYGEGNSYKIFWKNLEDFEEWLENGKVISEDA